MTSTMAQPGLAPDINILEAMDIFKNFPDEELPRYRNDPKLALVAAAEMDRRLRVRKDFEAKQQKPSGPVIDQLQQQLMGQPMGQEMPQQMPQQMPEAGLGALVPGMAHGGPVAFFAGGVGPEFGGDAISSAEDEERRQRILRERKLEEDRNRYQFLIQAGATEQAQRLAAQNPDAARPAPTAAEQPAKPADQKPDMSALIKQLMALQQSQQAATAAAPVDLKGLEKLAKEYFPATVVPMSMEDRRKEAEKEEKYLQSKFPDTVSPLAAQLAAEVGQQISPEEARRRAFMQAGIRGLGYTGRDFGAGLAGILGGYEESKMGTEAANKEARTLALKARLANEQYKDAVKRKDYESAKKYAEDVASYQEKKTEAENKAKIGKLGVMGAIQDLMTPKKTGGGEKGGPKFSDLSKIRQEAVTAAQPELSALEKRFDDEASMFYPVKGKRKTDWRQDPREMAEFEAEQQRILQKYERRYTPYGGETGVAQLTPQLLQILSNLGKPR